MKQISINIQNSAPLKTDAGTTILDLIKANRPAMLKNAVAATLNGQPVPLHEPLESDAVVDILTTDDAKGMEIFWHSSSHLMAQAVQALYPEAKLGIGPAIDAGFYYDFDLDTPITPEDLPRIEAKMKEIVSEDQPFTKEVLSKADAIKLFESRGEKLKIDLIREIPDETVSIYKNGPFVDLCRGPHIGSTKKLKHFKLLSVAGAYWRGDEKNQQLQRIYGVSFPKAKILEEHLECLEEAKKRDHRKLGKELDLFSFQAEGPGFPFWHAKGMILYNAVADYMRETLGRYGYQEIKTPIILNEELWHRSGHWDNYQENMYFTTIDDAPYAVKPMNCPGGLLVYRNQMHSYRDLPLKMAEMGLVHRHEKSGVLHGLFRVRQFTQDDAHVYCMPEQLEDQIIEIIDLINEVYTAFGYGNFHLELSTKPEKAIGSDDMWERAETALQNALEKKELAFKINPGDGAFYGPKIDYHIQDSLGRMWQCGTIQVDFSMPERFGLEYTGADGNKHRPVMIHRAILGSVERFIGILIEHFGGAFPMWLAPVQCVVLPISEKHHAYAETVYQQLKSAGIRAELDLRNEKVGFKIRESETQKIPCMCVIGDREVENGTVSLRKHREGDVGAISIDPLIEQCTDEINRRVNH